LRHIIPISGKDSLATAIVQWNRQPELDYEFVYNPTGLELPEAFDWIKRVGEYFGEEVNIVSKPLKDIIEINYNYFLPSPMARYCTKESKILPFIEWIGGEECFAYYGIRADEQREGFNNTTSKNITPIYPLKELGVNLEMVLTIVNKVGLKPPTFFWSEIYEAVKKNMAFDPKDILKEWQFDALFSWRSRLNCDRCFNQRLYEWVGLLEHYPERFWEAESWEHKGGEKSYSWNGNKFLKEIAEEKEIIKHKRVKHIKQMISNLVARKQGVLFTEVEKEEQFIDVLAVKSCGLFCGK
jgi:hypothetical protein